MARDRWTSRTTFVLGAIGSAVGLGNLWRFPFLVFDYGGGTFLIPYIIALFFFGIPLLLLEVTLGRQFQGGDPVCFASMHPRLVGIGWMSAYGSFILSCYYPVLIAWIVIFFCNSFQDPLPWELTGNGSAGLGGALTFFDVTVIADSGSIDVQETVNPLVILAMVFVWCCSYFSIFKGVGVVSQVVKISVPLPIITLAVLLFNSVGRAGSSDGVDAYVGHWDFAVLDDPQIWQAAVGQVFFSLGVCFGIMTAYSSYMESRKGLFVDSLVIAVSDTAVSFFAGFTVFTAIGVLAHDLGVEISDPNFKKRIGGATLVFVAYPAALASLDTAPQFFSIVFFLTVFFLAIDSAFSIVEAVVAAIYDTNAGRGVARWKIVLAVSVAAFCCGIFFAVDNGSYFLDIVDYYLNNFIMLGVGALECLSSQWIFGFVDSAKEFGYTSMMIYNLSYALATLLSVLMFVTLDYYNVALGFLVWPVVACLGFVGAYVTSPPMPRKFYKLLYSGGSGKLMDIIAVDEYDHWSNVTIPYSIMLHVWGFLLKYLIPVFLTILMITGAKANFAHPFEDFTQVFQNVGNFEVMIAWGILFLFMFIKIDVYSDRVAEHKKKMEKRAERLAELNPQMNDDQLDAAVESQIEEIKKGSVHEEVKASL